MDFRKTFEDLFAHYSHELPDEKMIRIVLKGLNLMKIEDLTEKLGELRLEPSSSDLRTLSFSHESPRSIIATKATEFNELNVNDPATASNTAIYQHVVLSVVRAIVQSIALPLKNLQSDQAKTRT